VQVTGEKLKVREICGDHGSAMAAGRQRDEGIVLKIPPLVFVPALRIPNLLD